MFWGPGLPPAVFWGPGLPPAVPEEAAGVGFGLLVIDDGPLAVDHNGVVPRGSLNPPPLATGQVLHHMILANRQVLGVIHHHCLLYTSDAADD